ncbi:hypothetical protein EJ04DRAFT_80564 [Polyplosphaeria fusca]|uniref:Ribosomal protein bL31m N-terminal domain-containing protein n=1 Tax=Polyplosphaeria fusca TaxID=682080 RepID=A0A9P4R7P7_9PLEO|nr:hypothetical protein EJ04DRAFT_80564 [Polyplosphaeria fusca]
MAYPAPSASALRALRNTIYPQTHHPTAPCGQVRHATLLRRPKRPYTFTQLVTLSDGSTFLHRTTSPVPVYKSTKDQRNTPLWNPSSQKLLNIEEDEAGKLRAFREKFGRGWDAEGTGKDADPADHLLDLISGRKAETKKSKDAPPAQGKPPAADATKSSAKK